MLNNPYERMMQNDAQRLKDYINTTVIPGTKRGMLETSEFVFGKNVKFYIDKTTKTHEVESWCIPVEIDLKHHNDAIYIGYHIAEAISDFEDQLLKKNKPVDVICHQLSDWVWLEDEHGKVFKHVPGTPDYIYQAALVKYAVLTDKKGDALSLKVKQPKYTPKEALNLQMRFDGGFITIKEFFRKLFLRLIEQKEEFDSKRPFGNSDWDGDIIVSLIAHDCIEGTLAEGCYIAVVDYDKANAFINDMAVEWLKSLA